MRFYACNPWLNLSSKSIADNLKYPRIIEDTAELGCTWPAAKRNDILDRVESCFCIDGRRLALFDARLLVFIPVRIARCLCCSIEFRAIRTGRPSYPWLPPGIEPE